MHALRGPVGAGNVSPVGASEDGEHALECPPDQIPTRSDHSHPEVPRRLGWGVVGVRGRLELVTAAQAGAFGLDRGWGEVTVARLAPGHDGEVRGLEPVSGHPSELTAISDSGISRDESP